MIVDLEQGTPAWEHVCTFCGRAFERKHGLSSHISRKHPDGRQGIVLAYLGGRSTASLASSYGCTENNIRAILIHRGISPRAICLERQTRVISRRKSSGRTLDETVFDVISPESAYWIGFIFADGCVRGNAMEIGLQTRDAAHLEKLRAFMGDNRKIRSGPNGKTVHYAFSSRHVVSRLREYGIVPRKSLSADPPSVLAVNRDFWRGVIDGDGRIAMRVYVPSFRHDFNLQPKPTVQITLGLAGSRQTVARFLAFAHTIKPAGQSVYKHAAVFRTALGGKNATPVIHALYDGATIALDRKAAEAARIAEFDRVWSRRNGALP